MPTPESLEVQEFISTQERMGNRFAQAISEIQQRFSPDSLPTALYVVLTDEETGQQFADAYRKTTTLNREVRLTSQSLPYRITSPEMIDVVDMLIEGLVQKDLVCDQHSFAPLREWMVRDYEDGHLLIQGTSGKLLDLYIVGLLNPISPQPEVVLR